MSISQNGEIPRLTPDQLKAVQEANLKLTRIILADPNARPEETKAARQTAINNGGTDKIY
ncbi:MAG: hypothetical protein WC503_04890 [Candidatus Shapirobacteria bacterium]